MNPGATTSPLTSTVSCAAGTVVDTETIRPPRMPTARTASRLVSGSMTRPLTSTMSSGTARWAATLGARRMANTNRKTKIIRTPGVGWDEKLESDAVSRHVGWADGAILSGKASWSRVGCHHEKNDRDSHLERHRARTGWCGAVFARRIDRSGAGVAAAHVCEPDRHRLQVQLRAAQRGHLVSLGGGSGHR